MKKSLSNIIFISVLFSCLSCQPENRETDVKTVVVEAVFRISTGEAIQYDLGAYPTEGRLSIISQAENFELSEIKFDQGNPSGVIYEYIPTENFIGNDFVKLLREDSDGMKIIRKTIYQFSFVVGG